MLVKDVMSIGVINVSPDTSIADAISIMIRNHVSGLPVVDESEKLIGIVSESDFMRRLETGTLRRRHRLEWLLGPGRLAEEYAHTRGQLVHEVMTKKVLSIQEDADLAEAVKMMQAHKVKRLPVLRGEDLAGIITRSDLMRALAILVACPYEDTVHTDDEIRAAVIAELNMQPWAPMERLSIDVDNGVVTLSGTITDNRQQDALRAAAQNVAGVRRVEDQLILGRPRLI